MTKVWRIFHLPMSNGLRIPCWSRLDEVLRGRLAWLHHALGSDVLAPDEAAEQFSHILSDLLLECGEVTD